MSRIPPRIPHKDINTVTFETGFDENLLVGALPCDMLICSCCMGVPRFPSMLSGCGHIFCEGCISNTLQKAPGHHHNRSGFRTAPCPNCRTQFDRTNILFFSDFQKLSQNMFAQIVVRCPQECGFNGTPAVVDDHQVYTCPKRPINCPFKGCNLVGEAQMMTLEHFPSCLNRQMYCPKCLLPCQATLDAPHDCILTLQEALRGSFTSTYLSPFSLKFLFSLKYSRA